MTSDFIAGAILTVVLAVWADLKTDIREIRTSLGLRPKRG